VALADINDLMAGLGIYAFLPTTDTFVQLLATVLPMILAARLIWGFRRRHFAPCVRELLLYPVKSCGEVSVQDVKVKARGFDGDRIFQVVCASDNVVCTPRDDSSARLFRLRPSLTKEGSLTLTMPGQAAHHVDLSSPLPRTCSLVSALGPDAVKLQLNDYGDAVADWLTLATGIVAARLTGIGSGYRREVVVNPDQAEPVPTQAAAPLSLADEAPVLLASTTSLADLNARLKARGKTPVDMRRFRPNVVISGLRPWEEDCIKTVRIGGVTFHAWQRCGRCKMTTIDRDTLETGPEPLATLSTFRERANGQRNFGMHLIPAQSVSSAELPISEMTISVGAPVEIVEWDDERRAEWTRTLA